MNCSPTLSAEDFGKLHNAKCELHAVLQSLEGVVHDRLYARFSKALADLEASLAGAYAQDEKVFDERSTHYRSVSDELNAMSIWSMYEVEDLRQPHPYAGAEVVRYLGKTVQISGTTYVDLFRAADQAIRLSGDGHHVFIECFSQNGFALELSTGS